MITYFTMTSILKILILAYTISRFEPIGWILDLLPNKLILNIFKLGMTCSKCLALWIGILCFNQLYIALAASFIMVLYERSIGKWEQKIKFQ